MTTVLVDHRHRVMFCYIPKAACSSWKHVLCQLNKEGVSRTTQQLIEDRTSKDWPGGKIHTLMAMGECGLQGLGQLDKATQTKVLSNYTKIMVVRHPIDRIISLYYDKLYVPHDDPNATCQCCKMWGKQIMKQDRKNATALQRKTGRGVTLAEFLRYTADTRHNSDHFNEQYKLCHPCSVNYDYILKTETMAQDALEVITRAFNSSLPFLSSNPTDKTTKEILHSTSLKDKLIKRFQVDFKMFGYKWKYF